MTQDTSKYTYQQVETYKEILELQHIKIKTTVVNVILMIFAVVVPIFMDQLSVSPLRIYLVVFMFVLLLFTNMFLYAQQHDLYNNLKLAMYITTIGIYVITTSLILLFETPSIFTGLFLAYAITAIYQDYKVMLISNGALFVVGVLLTVNFQSIFTIPGNTAIQNTFIVIFLVLFVLLLTLSSYILIKRKSFFYNHLAKIKEAEVRNMDLLMEIEQYHTKKTLDAEEYYQALDTFSNALSKKIGIENIFKRKIELLRDLKKHTPADLVETYPEYNEMQIKEMQRMELAVNTKLRNVAIKASKIKGIEVTKKEIFSESQFKSFKHFNDDRCVKIIAFVVFYVMLKMNKPYLGELTDDQIKDILFNSEYYYLIDRDVLEVYLNNNEVFDTIVNDILKGEWNYAAHN